MRAGGATWAIHVRDRRILEVTAADADAHRTASGWLAGLWARRLRAELRRAQSAEQPSAGRRRPVSYYPLLLVTALAFFVPLAMSRFRGLPVPVVVGEVLCGFAMGRSGLHLIGHDPALEFLAEFGFAYLMFLSGLEIDPTLIVSAGAADPSHQRRLARPLPIAILSFVITLLMAYTVASALVASGYVAHPWMMTLVLSTTSLAIVVPTLKECDLIDGSFGQTVLLAGLLADFDTMFLISGVAAIVTSRGMLKVLLGLVVVGAFLAAARAGYVLSGIPYVKQVFSEVSHATSHIGVRGSMALMLAFVALSQKLGTEMILGAFLAGFLVSLFSARARSDLYAKLDTLGFGFFVPIFFIVTGAQVDLSALLALRGGLGLAAMLVVAAFALKLVAVLPLRLLMPWRETVTAGVLLSAQLSLTLAAAEVGGRLGLLGPGISSAIILVALVTCIVGPVIFSAMATPPVRHKPRAVIVGAGETGVFLAQRLAHAGLQVTLLERSVKTGSMARKQVASVVIGDGLDGDDLVRAGAAAADVLICVTRHERMNTAICERAAALGIRRRIALVSSSRAAQRVRESGSEAVVRGLSTVLILESMITRPSAAALFADSASGKQIVDVKVRNPLIYGRKVSQIALPGDVLLLSLQRDYAVHVVHGDTQLRKGDSLTLIGNPGSVEEACAMLGGADWLDLHRPDTRIGAQTDGRTQG